jgi:hypothetical protein
MFEPVSDLIASSKFNANRGIFLNIFQRKERIFHINVDAKITVQVTEMHNSTLNVRFTLCYYV